MQQTGRAGRITAIEAQKRRKNRLSVFIDGEFAFGIEAEVAGKLGLTVGQEVDREDIERVLQAEELQRACQRAYRFLAACPRSESEVARRLGDYQYPDALIRQVLAHCRRLGYLDDAKFAAEFAASRVVQKRLGPVALKFELRRRGVAEALIEAAVQQAYASTSETELVLALIKKKLKSLRNLPYPKARQRITAFLLRKGFHRDLVQDLLEKKLDRKNWDTPSGS